MLLKTDVSEVLTPSTIKLAIGAALGTLAFIPSALAETQNTADSSSDVIAVYASRIDAQKANGAAAVSTVSLEEIEKRQGTSVADLISHLPNVSIAGGGRDESQAIVIRGLSSDNGRVIQLIDGVRQNFSLGHRSSLFIDPELLKTVDVVRGPASTVWGSGAIGGVVAQSTKSAYDFLDADQDIGGYLKQGFHSNDNASRTSGAVFGRTDTIDWLVQSYYHDADDNQLGNGKALSYSASREKGGLAKVTYTPSLVHQWTFSARQGDRDAMSPSNPSVQDPSSNYPLVYRQTQDQSLAVAYQYTPMNDWIDLSSRVYWNDTQMKEYRLVTDEHDDNQMQTLGLSLTNRAHFNDIEFIAGFDGYLDHYQTQRDDKSAPGERPEGQDAKARSIGVFGQLEIPLAESWQWTAGLRFDDYKNEDTRATSTIEDASDSQWSPSTALTWNVTERLALTASYQEAFRAPSLEEMYASGTHFVVPRGPSKLINRFVPNPNLKPEQSANKELALTYQFAPMAYLDSGYIDARVFRNDVEDFIEMNVDFMGATTTRQNVSNAKLEGVELSFHHEYGQFKNDLSYSQMEGKDKADGRYLEQIPAHKLVAETDYRLATLPVNLGARVSHYADQNENPDQKTYDGYTLWDLYASYSPKGAWDGVKFDLAIENLTDEYYTTAWSQVASPGRDIKLNVRYQF
ncbi:TonB-dependent hemoglobin/transferrin/lactoferrin family receptor [Salinivibrio sp. YCSC6]|uniref:TonB-dependent hemoglobin/transferrin/lactoferrin family receptor n=1 Tax=Salinivibrio sp. YCSC6 TaxID=2003370 RepID=UPI000BBCF469|nr:TonB-dependent hemoglobin/transferrin/lactoferrin family receptor [Salinivibrio sp. YCSC6]PCE67120.1 hypothetical protein B6G00_01720 [Salinivibrio sp. YCSC6]QCF35983.1 TonB-dependent hemoglobin/transferrin/lactoferrin family receptor [Salinivibrio sp. YCSC6]